MRLVLGMQSDEVFSIEGRDGAFKIGCKRENLAVGNCLFRLSGFQNCEDIMSQTPKFLDNGMRKILVRVKPSHVTRSRFREFVVRLPHGERQ